LTRKQSVDNQVGHRCDTLVAQGWTGAKLQKHYAANTGAIPENYIAVGALDKIVKSKKHLYPGLTITRMVNCFGKDRGVEPAIHPIAKPIYDARRWRWVNEWLATDAGLKAIASGDFSKAPK
jgi:hypothetical protein